MAEKPFEKLTPRVTFLQVRSAQEKFWHIAAKTRIHFRKKEPFLLFVEDEKGQQFVDELLWKFPEEGFLPHKVLENPEEVPIAITRTKKNVNGAKAAFNLCPTPLLISGLRIIYDFEDFSAPNKQSLSAARFASYKQVGYILEAC